MTLTLEKMNRWWESAALLFIAAAIFLRSRFSKRPVLLFVCGSAGSGKSTVARIAANLFGNATPVIEVSSVVGQALGVSDRASKLRPSYEDLVKLEGHLWLAKRLESAVVAYQSSVAVISGLRELVPYAHLYKQYPSYLIYLDLPAQTRYARLKKRDDLADRKSFNIRQAKEKAVFGKDMASLKAAATLVIR